MSTSVTKTVTINYEEKQAKLDAPYNIIALLENQDFSDHVSRSLAEENAGCFPCTYQTKKDKTAQKAARIVLENAIENHSTTELSCSGSSRSFTRYLNPGPNPGHVAGKLGSVIAACLEADPACSEKKWFKHYSTKVDQLKNNRPVILSKEKERYRQFTPKVHP